MNVNSHNMAHLNVSHWKVYCLQRIHIHVLLYCYILKFYMTRCNSSVSIVKVSVIQQPFGSPFIYSTGSKSAWLHTCNHAECSICLFCVGTKHNKWAMEHTLWHRGLRASSNILLWVECILWAPPLLRDFSVWESFISSCFAWCHRQN